MTKTKQTRNSPSSRKEVLRQRSKENRRKEKQKKESAQIRLENLEERNQDLRKDFWLLEAQISHLEKLLQGSPNVLKELHPERTTTETASLPPKTQIFPSLAKPPPSHLPPPLQTQPSTVLPNTLQSPPPPSLNSSHVENKMSDQEILRSIQRQLMLLQQQHHHHTSPMSSSRDRPLEDTPKPNPFGNSATPPQQAHSSSPTFLHHSASHGHVQSQFQINNNQQFAATQNHATAFMPQNFLPSTGTAAAIGRGLSTLHLSAVNNNNPHHASIPTERTQTQDAFDHSQEFAAFEDSKFGELSIDRSSIGHLLNAFHSLQQGHEPTEDSISFESWLARQYKQDGHFPTQSEVDHFSSLSKTSSALDTSSTTSKPRPRNFREALEGSPDGSTL